MPGTLPKEKAEQRPFSFQWLNSCYQQTLLPDAPWHKLQDVIAQALASKVEKQFSHPQRKEMIMELLGEHFCDTYLSHISRNPQILELPEMSGSEREALRTEAQSWLNSQMYKVVKELGYQNIFTGTGSGEPPPEDFADFLQQTFSLFHTGLDRELYLQETILAKRKQAELSKKKSKKSEYLRIPAPSRIKPLSTTSGSATSSAKPSSGAIRAMVHNVEGDPPPLWGSQSDAIGRSLVSLLERDPRKFAVVAAKLHGRQLPGSLRAFMWSDVLFRMERKRMKEVSVEKIVRERFAKAMSRGLTELKIQKPTQSPINGLIENAVIETYCKTTAMASFRNGEFMKETVRALNVLYVYDRSYEPYLIHWLFPIQISFRKASEASAEKGEQALELAMYLDLLNANCFPTWPQVFAIAERVMNTLHQSDPELHDHLRNIATVNFQVNPKEFLVQLIHQEKTKAEELLKATPGSSKALTMSSELLADPLIFMRRWIGEGFVSVLDTPGVMYLWDQCFMQHWQHSVLQNFCLSLLELMRHLFMDATDYITMKEAFLVQPCKLYTCDVQRAWIYLENGGDLMDIPYFNRQRPMSPRFGSRMSAVDSPVQESPLLHPVGVKQVTIKLVIPAETLKKEKWLAKVDTSNLKLMVSAYFGTVKMKSRLSLTPADLLETSKDNYKNTIYRLLYSADKFVFEDLDVSQYDVERELGAYPYAIVRLEYSKVDKRHGTTSVPVGWARVPLFRRGDGRKREAGWVLLEGETTFTLHPGEVPESLISVQPKTPSESEQESLIGYNSELMATVYDPNMEPQSPALIPPSPDIPPQIPPADTRETPRPPPPDWVDDIPWVATSASAARNNPAPSTNMEPFDLYVDQVRFIPDSASVIKVTGRVLKTGDIGTMPDILTFPDLTSKARSPRFTYRYTVNKDSRKCEPDTLILLRVYTVDIITEKVQVIGSCLLPVFRVNPDTGDCWLRVGGQQLRLHTGMPEMPQGIAGLKDTDFHECPMIPACTLLVRLVPHTQDHIPTPVYKTGYFETATCRPTVSEQRIFESYKDSMSYPETETDMIRKLQTLVNVQPGRTDSALMSWMTQRLEMKKEAGVAKPAGNLSLIRCVRYRIKVGVNIKVNEAYGLPEGYYIQCFGRIAPGQKVLGMNPTVEGHGKEEKFITAKIHNDSLMQSPRWTDEPQELHPFYDSYSCLIIQLFGLRLTYKPRPDHKSAGIIASADGSPLELTDDNILGWAVVPLFEGNSILAGTHYVPVFKDKPSKDILDKLSKASVQNVLEETTWTEDTKYPTASMAVTLWDAHYEFNENPDMPIYEYLLESTGDVDEYHHAQNETKGAYIHDIVLNSLDAKTKKQGTQGAIYQKEQKFFDTEMSKIFVDLMESALLTAGYGPL